MLRVLRVVDSFLPVCDLVNAVGALLLVNTERCSALLLLLACHFRA